mmetsp:Transcript_19079/g.48967  ORF Transcript_19079/g.48967 Transcript_19079/m.48967 type:complete len:245 (-) Transcript_19079:1397-2131(-)
MARNVGQRNSHGGGRVGACHRKAVAAELPPGVVSDVEAVLCVALRVKLRQWAELRHRGDVVPGQGQQLVVRADHEVRRHGRRGASGHHGGLLYCQLAQNIRLRQLLLALIPVANHAVLPGLHNALVVAGQVQPNARRQPAAFREQRAHQVGALIAGFLAQEAQLLLGSLLSRPELRVLLHDRLQLAVLRASLVPLGLCRLGQQFHAPRFDLLNLCGAPPEALAAEVVAEGALHKDVRLVQAPGG